MQDKDFLREELASVMVRALFSLRLLVLACVVHTLLAFSHLRTKRINVANFCSNSAEVRAESFRRQAVQYCNQMKTYFEESAKAANRGRMNEAAMLSSKGYAAKRSMELANENAAYLIIKKQECTNTLDLHGLREREAIIAVNSFIEDVTAEGIHRSVEIITGVGSHSRNGIPVLLPAVIKLCEQKKWVYTASDYGVRIEISHSISSHTSSNKPSLSLDTLSSSITPTHWTQLINLDGTQFNYNKQLSPHKNVIFWIDTRKTSNDYIIIINQYIKLLQYIDPKTINYSLGIITRYSNREYLKIIKKIEKNIKLHYVLPYITLLSDEHNQVSIWCILHICIYI